MAVKTNEIVEGSVPEELLKLLLTLSSSWEDVADVNTFKVIPLKGAMTNEVFRIIWPTKGKDNLRTVLVRVYGEGVEMFFNRDEEIRTFECMSEHGYGPKLLGHFPDGRIEEFIHAKTLSAADLRDPETSALIAAKLREFHELDMPGSKNVVLWDRLRNWLSKAKSLCTTEHVKDFWLDKLEKEIEVLEKECSQDGQEIGFCHNDLQYGNIMIDESTRSITLIDYEYASYNPVAYDIANHFCEMAANYHTDTPHILNYNVYPDVEERQRFIRAYLSSAGQEPNDAEVQHLDEDIEKYTLANHLFWGLWGIISVSIAFMLGFSINSLAKLLMFIRLIQSLDSQAYVNCIDFDYIEYARQRFEQYWLKKSKILGISMDSLNLKDPETDVEK